MESGCRLLCPGWTLYTFPGSIAAFLALPSSRDMCSDGSKLVRLSRLVQKCMHASGSCKLVADRNGTKESPCGSSCSCSSSDTWDSSTWAVLRPEDADERQSETVLKVHSTLLQLAGVQPACAYLLQWRCHSSNGLPGNHRRLLLCTSSRVVTKIECTVCAPAPAVRRICWSNILGRTAGCR